MTAFIDLHLHSTASDGSYSPSKLIEMAQEKGLSAIALTDHDTIDGIKEFVAHGKKRGIEAIPGVEFGVSNDKERNLHEVHLLGYFIDSHESPAGIALKKLQKAKMDWSVRQIEALSKAGYSVDYPDVQAIAAGSPTVRRPHIWQALEAKYKKDIDREEYYRNTSSGGKWYVEKALTYSIEEAIKLVLDSQGIPVLAHPAFYGTWESPDTIPPAVQNVIDIAVSGGVKGVETIYAYDAAGRKDFPKQEQITSLVEKTALANNLVMTGGSDFHGEVSKSVKMAEVTVPYRFLEELRACYKRLFDKEAPY